MQEVRRKAVVTGGAGFVGSALVRKLVAEGWQVIVYDLLKPGRVDYLPADMAHIELIVDDILNYDRLVQAFREHAPEVVYHLAAIHYIPYCNAHPLETMRVNVEGTESVLRACREADVPRVVFASTAAVYPAQSGLLNEETTTAAPMDIYGYTKLFGEQLVTWHQELTKRPAVIARFFNVYGPRETSRHLIPELLDQLIDGVETVRIGNLEPKRDYIYVDDIARAVFELSQLDLAEQTIPLCVNIGTGEERSAKAVLDELQAVSGRTITLVQDPARMRPSDRPNLCADVSKLRSLLGWSPSTDFRGGLERLVQWTVEFREEKSSAS